ncbi:MAG: hypothetical protein US30_C0015G0013 [Candidatus Moranbacteria bacterium GW2011_GWF2_36_839]|nr:MAG: hypothetical protein US27_C0016G0007 [Candidatus Moranbacteria bacterium GW2011_GWF1_36_78]KKQ16534.1 MAG: hypothetical protein US30_C0015G0013 [Candidatus Moranbacteria bacterium GW2011_GWF2_36_839]
MSFPRRRESSVEIKLYYIKDSYSNIVLRLDSRFHGNDNETATKSGGGFLFLWYNYCVK